MKAKYLFAALSIPAMFAACSQEELVTELQQQENLLGTPAGEVTFTFDDAVDSRLSWGATDKPDWDGKEEFSMFWLGTTDANNVETYNTSYSVFKSQANALYQREAEGQPFSSANIVYVGNHVIVYPADKAHMSDKKIEVAVGQFQDGSKALGLRSIYTSDKLNIQAGPAPETPAAGVIYAAGYNNPISASVKPLTSNLVLNLDFVMSTNMTEVEVKQVNLVTNNNVFAVDGYLYEKEENGKNRMAVVSKSARVNKVGVTLPANTKVTSTYTVQIALLPVDATTLASTSTYAIEVVTNYGTVTIDKAKLVKSSNGLYLSTSANDAASNQEAIAAETTPTTALNMQQELALTYTYNPASYRTKAYNLGEKDQSYGKRITLTATVEMKNASITNLPVEDSEQLIEAYNIYDLLGKTGVENFNLVGKKVNNASLNERFELTPAALKAIKEHEDVTLTIANTDTLVLVGAFDAVPELSEVKSTTNHSDVTLALGEGTEWTLDMKNAKIYNSWKEIAVFGSLAISESAETATEEEVFGKSIINYGEVEFEGEVTMNKLYTQTKGKTTIPATSTVTINNAATNNINGGTVEVEGTLIADQSPTVLNIAVGTTVEVSGSLLQSNSAQINNAGTINIAETGAAIINDNLISTDNGSIVLASRTNSVKTSANKGYIKFAFTGEEFKSATTDAFNYLILNGNVKINHDGIAITNIEIAAGSTVETTTTGAIELDEVIVGTGAKLRIPVGSAITTDNTSGAGNVEVYGTYTTTATAGHTGKIFRFN